MPLVTIKVFEARLQDPAFARRLALAVDAAVTEVCGGDTRPDTWVLVEGVPAAQWAFNGEFMTPAPEQPDS